MAEVGRSETDITLPDWPLIDAPSQNAKSCIKWFFQANYETVLKNNGSLKRNTRCNRKSISLDFVAAPWPVICGCVTRGSWLLISSESLAGNDENCNRKDPEGSVREARRLTWARRSCVTHAQDVLTTGNGASSDDLRASRRLVDLLRREHRTYRSCRLHRRSSQSASLDSKPSPLHPAISFLLSPSVVRLFWALKDKKYNPNKNKV